MNYIELHLNYRTTTPQLNWPSPQNHTNHLHPGTAPPLAVPLGGVRIHLPQRNLGGYTAEKKVNGTMHSDPNDSSRVINIGLGTMVCVRDAAHCCYSQEWLA